MLKQNCLFYSFLLIFVVGDTVNSKTTTLRPSPFVGDTVNSKTTTPTPSPFITYTCGVGGVTDLVISEDDAKHIVVLKKDGSYCKQATKNQAGIRKCVEDFKTQPDVNGKKGKVTILYEEETTKDIVGGKNAMYYELSCDEKADNVTVVMKNMNVQTAVPTLHSVLHPKLTEIPSFEVLEHPQQKNYYVGERITLQLHVNTGYTLLPQTCTAYRSDDDSISHKFWEHCQLADAAIISSNSWTPTPDRGTLRIVMYAFRFIDIDTLTIKCETTVCPQQDPSACNVDCHSRKRRRANHQKTNLTNATVSIAMKVSDRQFQDNSGQVVSPVCSIYTIGFGMIYWLTSENFY